MKELRQVASSDLSLPSDSYVYKLVHTRAGLAAISSDDSLRIFEPSTLHPLPDGIFPSVNESVTCLESFAESAEASPVVVTAGRDGRVRLWDLRLERAALDIASRRSQSFGTLKPC